jgi:glycosyltransferase involved in cell wall biosynthesis
VTERETPPKLGDVAAEAGLRRVHLLAWRDLDDPEAGGSELHAATVARLWAEAGIEVTMRTSFAAGRRAETVRDGYRVVRRAGRYLVFPRAVLAELTGRHGPADGVVEVWNGMPFFTPLWARVPHVAFVHHLHAEMWRMVLPPNLARLGELVEYRLAPPVYRNSAVVTLSPSAREELVRELRLRPDRVHVVPPGVDPRFSPGGLRSPVPLVVAVGRLVPVKRFDLLVEVLVELRRRHPALEAVVVGDGYEREALEARVHALDAADWLRLPGRLDPDALVDLYRKAWVLASSSAREGWGMTITEAGACGTPAVATRVPGHLDAVEDGRTGLLADGRDGLVAALDRLVADDTLRARLGRAAADHAARLTWEATALGTLQVLAGEAHRRRRPA